MKKKRTDAEPEALTYDQIETLARSVATDLAGGLNETASALMLLMSDIRYHPQGAETIANLLASSLIVLVEPSAAIWLRDVKFIPRLKSSSVKLKG